MKGVELLAKGALASRWIRKLRSVSRVFFFLLPLRLLNSVSGSVTLISYIVNKAVSG